MSEKGRSPIERLSVPTVRRRPRRALLDEELFMLRRVGRVLIPQTVEHAGVSDLSEFDELASEAVAIVDPDLALLGELSIRWGDVHDDDLAFAIRQLHAQEPRRFVRLSMIVAGIHLYSPTVIAALGYPLPHRNAAPAEQIADELMTGILDPVISRGSIFRPPAPD